MTRQLIIAIATAIVFTGCDSQPKTEEAMPAEERPTAEGNEERNRKVAMASIEGIQAHNADAVIKDAAPGFKDYGDGSIPPMENLDSARAMINAWLTAFPDYKGENFQYVADGDYVFVYADWTGTFKGEFMGMKPTGKSFKIKDVDIFKFNGEGKITEHRAVQSMQSVFESLGATPPKQ